LEATSNLGLGYFGGYALNGIGLVVRNNVKHFARMHHFIIGKCFLKLRNEVGLGYVTHCHHHHLWTDNAVGEATNNCTLIGPMKLLTSHKIAMFLALRA